MASALTLDECTREPRRAACPGCASPILVALIETRCNAITATGRRCRMPAGLDTDHLGFGRCGAHEGQETTPAFSLVIAEAREWEPRARCYVCATIETSGKKRERCDRCGGEGYVGSNRPHGVLLAVDVAWGDDMHLRLVGPGRKRERGEAFYPLHLCEGLTPDDQPVIVPGHELQPTPA